MATVRRTRRRVKRGQRGQSSFVEKLQQDTERVYSRAIEAGKTTRQTEIDLNRIAHRMSSSVENQLLEVTGIESTVFEGISLDSLAAWRQQNVGLITTATEEVKSALARVLSQNPDLHPSALAPLIQEATGVEKSKALFWARDQTNKLHAQVTQERAKTMGIERYVWRTAGPGDERVRDSHKEREGQIFEFDNPPEGGNPGEAHQCRCTAEVILE